MSGTDQYSQLFPQHVSKIKTIKDALFNPHQGNEMAQTVNIDTLSEEFEKISVSDFSSEFEEISGSISSEIATQSVSEEFEKITLSEV